MMWLVHEDARSEISIQAAWFRVNSICIERDRERERERDRQIYIYIERAQDVTYI